MLSTNSHNLNTDAVLSNKNIKEFLEQASPEKIDLLVQHRNSTTTTLPILKPNCANQILSIKKNTDLQVVGRTIIAQSYDDQLLQQHLTEIVVHDKIQIIALVLKNGGRISVDTMAKNITIDSSPALKWYLDNPNVDTDKKAQAIKLVLSKGSNIAIDLVAKGKQNSYIHKYHNTTNLLPQEKEEITQNIKKAKLQFFIIECTGISEQQLIDKHDYIYGSSSNIRKEQFYESDHNKSNESNASAINKTSREDLNLSHDTDNESDHNKSNESNASAINKTLREDLNLSYDTDNESDHNKSNESNASAINKTSREDLNLSYDTDNKSDHNKSNESNEFTRNEVNAHSQSLLNLELYQQYKDCSIKFNKMINDIQTSSPNEFYKIYKRMVGDKLFLDYLNSTKTTNHNTVKKLLATNNKDAIHDVIFKFYTIRYDTTPKKFSLLQDYLNADSRKQETVQAINLVLSNGDNRAIDSIAKNITVDSNPALKWYLDNPNVDIDSKVQAIKSVLSNGGRISIDTIAKDITVDSNPALKWYLDNPNVDTDSKAQAIKLVLSNGGNIAIDAIATGYPNSLIEKYHNVHNLDDVLKFRIAKNIANSELDFFIVTCTNPEINWKNTDLRTSTPNNYLVLDNSIIKEIDNTLVAIKLDRYLNLVKQNGDLQNIRHQSSNISSLVTTQEISIDIIQQIFQKLITEDSNITTLNELSNVIRTLIRLKDDKEYIISQQCIEKALQEFWDQNSSFENGLIILHDLKRLNIDDTTKWEYIIEKKVIERIFNSACDNSLMRVVDALLLEQRKDDKLGKDQFIISNDIIKTRFCSLLELEGHNNEIIKRLIDVRRDSYYVIDNDYIQEIVINSEQIPQTLIYLERDESYIIDDVIYPILELCLSQGNQSILQQLINLMRDDDYIIDQNMIKDIFIQLLKGSNDPAIQKLITLTRDNDYLIQDDSFKKYLIKIIQDNKEIRLIEPLINLKREDKYLIKEDTIVNIFKEVSTINAMHKVTEVLISAKRINDHLIKENTINEAFKKASLGNMYETVKMFICAKREGTSIIQDDVKKDALQDAATKGHVLIVKELINNSTNEFLKEFLPQALVCAASNNRIEVIRLINDHYADYIDYSTKKRAGQKAFESGYRKLAKEEFDYDSDSSPPLKKLKNICGSSNPVDTGMSEDSIKDNMQMLQCTEIYFIDESDLINTTVLLKDNILAILKVQNQNNNHAVVFFKYGDNVSIIDPLDIKSEFSDSFIKLKHNLLNLGIKTIDIVYSGLQQPDSGVCADISLILVKNLADKLQDIQSVQDVISIIQDVRIEMYGRTSEKNQETIIVKSFDTVISKVIDGLTRLNNYDVGIQDKQQQNNCSVNNEFVFTVQQDNFFIKSTELTGDIVSYTT